MNEKETAYFAGGCFWCITPAFRELPGVYHVVSGYSGGEEENPSYEDVKYQRTGHRETIRIDYDPAQVAFEQLMDIFLGSVDPYDPDGQFIDRGFLLYPGSLSLLRRPAAGCREEITGVGGSCRTGGIYPCGAFQKFLAGRGIPPGLLPEKSGSLPKGTH